MTDSRVSCSPRPTWNDLSARAALSAAQLRVLETIESSETPLTSTEIGDRLALHHNTVREHVEGLLRAELITVSARPTGRRGRPALRYKATAPSPLSVLDSYVALLDAVSQALGDGEQAVEAARAIGARWAQGVLETTTLPQLAATATKQERLEALLPLLGEMGFDPQREGEEIELRSCPLVTQDRAPHPHTCHMHEGCLQEIARDGGLTASPSGTSKRQLAIEICGPRGCRLRLNEN